MMKKHLLMAAALTLTVLAAPALAAENGTYRDTRAGSVYNDSSLTGFYVGALGGYGWSDLGTSIGNANPAGGDYGLFFGYKLDQYLQNSLGINGAIEFHYAWSNADDNVAGIDVEKDHEWGVSFRPGLSFLPGLSSMTAINPYGILGYKRTQYSASAGAISGDESYDGFELGIGTELVAWGNMGLRAEYAHTWYHEENGIDPDEDTLRMGLAYHF